MNLSLSTWIRTEGYLLARQAERDSCRPERVQRELLLRLLQKNARAEYGMRYGFGTIRGTKDYAARVPVVEYSDIEADVDRMKQGDTNVLTAEPTLVFSLTSGTSDRPKFIPITRTGQRRTRQLMTQWFHRALRDHPTMFNKGILDITGSPVEGRCACGIPYGSASGMILASMPGVMRRIFCTPAEVAQIDDYELRCYAIARFAYAKELSFIGTPNPLTLVKLAATGTRHAEEIIRCIHNGWFSESLRDGRDGASAGVPLSLRAALSPRKTRAAFLAGILEKTGALHPRDCWPHLALIGCWLGGSIGFHANALIASYGNIPRRDLGYMASEGSITIPFADDTSSGLPALRNHYFEFIPLDDDGSPAPDIFGAHELETGRCYRILLTNDNGLYRYDINDIVRVDGFHKQTPLISFVSKSGTMTNIVGEKLHLNHLLFAMEKLQSRFSLGVRQFRAASDIGTQRYEVFLDVPQDLTTDFLRDSLLPTLDDLLCECNIEYAAKRKSGRLHPPRIHLMKPGWEQAAQLEHASFSRRDSQYKWLPLVSEILAVDLRYIARSVEPKFGK